MTYYTRNGSKKPYATQGRGKNAKAKATLVPSPPVRQAMHTQAA